MAKRPASETRTSDIVDGAAQRLRPPTEWLTINLARLDWLGEVAPGEPTILTDSKRMPALPMQEVATKHGRAA